MIRVENLVFEYRQDDEKVGITAIDGLSISIPRGSFTAVIGRNGSGKSTLAKNLNALLLPCGGAVYIHDFDTSRESDVIKIRQAVGMVFQNPDNQLVSSIAEDDVAFGPENLGIDPILIRERVDEALSAVGMYEYRKMAPHLLSGGQKQRIAIAGVVAMRPECIVFDEPTAMLDPGGRREVLEIIKKLNRDGITIILITHFMEEAAAAERIIIMDKGKIVMDGTPVAVFSRAADIEGLSLDVPLAVDMAHKLRSMGIDVPADIIGTDELVTYLCQYK